MMIAEVAGEQAAIEYVFSIVSAVRRHKAHRLLGYSESGLEKVARTIASRATDIWLYTCNRPNSSIELASAIVRQRGERLCRRLGISSPDKTEDGIARRFMDSAWWLRKFRKAVYPMAEQIAKDLGLLHEYSSRAGQRTRRGMLKKQADWLNSHFVRCEETDATVPLSELAEKAQEREIAQLVARITGLQRYAESRRWTGCMVTITVPGSFRHDDTTLQDALDYLRDVWHSISIKRNQRNLAIAGTGVFQPHLDGFPHLHCFAYGDQGTLKKFCEIVKTEALKVYPDEPGAMEHRVDIEWEDHKKGRLSSYMLRYCVREFARPTEPSATEKNGGAADSWYAMQRARRIFWFGLPPIQWWQICFLMSRKQAKGQFLRLLRRAARQGDYCRWLELLGGITGKSRKGRNVKTIYEIRKNKYEEPTKRWIGAAFGRHVILVRVLHWIVERKVIENGPRLAEEPHQDRQTTVKNPATGPPAACR
ncbi:hypothetical protein D6833_03665 [Candidatus Parcubacteria bacterium]|nr:MAG: hypothetical protein D6833_03665 [Candidatus Parcubacteria bacterium]